MPWPSQAAAEAAVPVRVVAGHAGALPAEDATVDAAVASLVLCSVADVPAVGVGDRHAVPAQGNGEDRVRGGVDDA